MQPTYPAPQRLQGKHLADLLSLAHAADPDAWPDQHWETSLHQDWVLGLYDPQGQLMTALILGRTPFDAEVYYLLSHPLVRRQGWAQHLLQAGLALAFDSWQVEQVLLEVRASNHPAQQLYLAAGFEKSGVRRRYYPARETEGEREDAWLYHLNAMDYQALIYPTETD